MTGENKNNFLALIYYIAFIVAIGVMGVIIKGILTYTQSLISGFIIISILGYILYFTHKEKKDIKKEYEQLLRYSYENIKKKKTSELEFLDDKLMDFECEFKEWLLLGEAKLQNKKRKKPENKNKNSRN